MRSVAISNDGMRIAIGSKLVEKQHLVQVLAVDEVPVKQIALGSAVTGVQFSQGSLLVGSDGKTMTYDKDFELVDQ